MMYNPKAIANEFLNLAEDDSASIDPMKIQKLIFYAHGWYLALYDVPLIDEIVEAWQYGPVLPSLFYEFKEFGASPIKRRALEFDSDLESTEPYIPREDERPINVIRRIWEVYGGFSALQLSEMSHTEGGPWDHIRKSYPGIRNPQIPNELIMKHFKELA